ncbi:MAG TPA: L,D-transpeptidase [Gemmatimonadaceae bacterium]
MRSNSPTKWLAPVVCVLLATACVVKSGDDTAASDTAAVGTTVPPVTTAPTPPPLPPPDMRIEVDLTARQLHVYRGGARAESHPVAVGSAEWPTQTGSWGISQVVWNPEWVPPDESWAKDESPKDPGAPDNPLGRAQLVYDPPRSIHGTNDPSSIGKAVSHGSIRVTNEVATQLARAVMEAAGVSRDEAWFTQVRENRTRKEVVDLPQPIPIRVY